MHISLWVAAQVRVPLRLFGGPSVAEFLQRETLTGTGSNSKCMHACSPKVFVGVYVGSRAADGGADARGRAHQGAAAHGHSDAAEVSIHRSSPAVWGCMRCAAAAAAPAAGTRSKDSSTAARVYCELLLESDDPQAPQMRIRHY